MSEIENMYGKVGIKICKRKQGFTLKDCTDRDCKQCGYYVMPPFTAEKQIELIKWLAGRKVYEQTDSLNLGIWFAFGEFAMGIGVEPFNDRLGFDLAVKGETFEMCLAKLINNLWLDLTKEEKQQVKGILE